MKVFGTHDPATLAQLEDVRSRATNAALMADGHVSYVMPIGGVAAFREQVSVVGVGFDMACGNAAILTTSHSRSLETRRRKRSVRGILAEAGRTNGRMRRSRQTGMPTSSVLVAHVVRQQSAY